MLFVCLLTFYILILTSDSYISQSDFFFFFKDVLGPLSSPDSDTTWLVRTLHWFGQRFTQSSVAKPANLWIYEPSKNHPNSTSACITNVHFPAVKSDQTSPWRHAFSVRKFGLPVHRLAAFHTTFRCSCNRMWQYTWRDVIRHVSWRLSR